MGSPTSLILLLYTSRALPVFSNLHIRLMNPVVQIGKIKIAQETLQLLLPALPMFYNYYIVNVIIIILCQLTRFFVHRVKTTIKNRKIYRLDKKKKKNIPSKKKKKKKKKK